MNGLKCKDGCYCPAPTCLLHVNKAGQLLPIAIKLQPGEGNPIFFPTDHWMDWLTAKIYFKSAEGQVSTCSMPIIHLVSRKFHCQVFWILIVTDSLNLLYVSTLLSLLKLCFCELKLFCPLCYYTNLVNTHIYTDPFIFSHF